MLAAFCLPGKATAQKGYLDDDAVVRKTIDKRVGQSLGHELPVVVVGLVPDVQHWLVDVAHTVPQQIDGHHGQRTLATVNHIVRTVILNAKILAEAQRLRLKPSLLKFNKYQVNGTVRTPHTGTEVDSQDGNRVALVVHMLLGTHVHLQDVLFQQGGQDGARNALVLHKILEHHVIDRVCNGHHKPLII